MLGLDKIDGLSTKQLNDVKLLVSEFRDVFAESDSDLGLCKIMEQDIVLTDNIPVRAPYYNVPLKLRPAAEIALKELLDLGVIQHSKSDYHSPSFLLKKPNGSYRVLTDFRLLNKKIVRSYAPLSGVEEMLANWHGCRFYSKLDLLKGFYQSKLTEASRRLTAFSIPGCGFYEYLRSPLGLASSPTFFQSLMEKMFLGLKQKTVMVYLDDCLSGSPTVEGMIRNLRQMFSRIRESGMLLNTRKCELFKKQLKFLGYILNEQGVAVCPDKVAAIAEMAPPRNVKGVRSLVGMCNFFRRFVKDFGKICQPL